MPQILLGFIIGLYFLLLIYCVSISDKPYPKTNREKWGYGPFWGWVFVGAAFFLGTLV